MGYRLLFCSVTWCLHISCLYTCRMAALPSHASPSSASPFVFFRCNSKVSSEPSNSTITQNGPSVCAAAAVLARDMSDLPDCQVCSKIMTVFKAVHQARLVEYELGELSGVISMPCPHSDSIRKLWESEWQHNVLTPERWSVRISHIGWETDATIEFYDGEEDRYNIFHDVELVATDEPKHPGTSILIDPQWIDPSVPKDWYSECLDEHGSGCDE